MRGQLSSLSKLGSIVLLVLAASHFSYTVYLVNQGTYDATSPVAVALSNGKVRPEHAIGCLTDKCILSVAAQLARAYPWRDDRSWCIQSDPQAASNATNVFVDEHGRYHGLILVKVPKAASSTSAGVAIRISKRHDCEALQWMHRLAVEYRSVNHEHSFVFTTLRDPGARAVSSVFFHVISRIKDEPTDRVVLSNLRSTTDAHYGSQSDGQGGFQLRYTSFASIPKYSAWDRHNPRSVKDPALVVERVRQALAGYNFVIVTERMDESLVAMSLLLGIGVGDVLVTASKVAGSRYHLVKPNGAPLTCLPTIKSFVSPAVQEYLASHEWRAPNYGDYLFYQAANQSLDLTIERTIGRERFDKAYSEYLDLKRREEEQCAPHVVFPCSNDGQPQPKLARDSCYFRHYDFGCGYKCIDAMLESDAAKK